MQSGCQQRRCTLQARRAWDQWDGRACLSPLNRLYQHVMYQHSTARHAWEQCARPHLLKGLGLVRGAAGGVNKRVGLRREGSWVGIRWEVVGR